MGAQIIYENLTKSWTSFARTNLPSELVADKCEYLGSANPFYTWAPAHAPQGAMPGQVCSSSYYVLQGVMPGQVCSSSYYVLQGAMPGQAAY